METKKVIIKYLLSEEGQKKSLLAGGDGKVKQEVQADITADAVELAEVDYRGNTVIDLAKALVNKVYVLNAFEPYIYREARNTSFDEPQSAEQLITFEKERQARIAAQEKALQPELEKALAKAAEEKARRKAENEQQEKERAALEAVRAAEKERQEVERLAWISENGSDYLQRAVKLGYNCQRQYVTERAKKEFPYYTVDFDQDAYWKDRACPSPEALEEVERLIQQGHDAKVVWLTAPVREPGEGDKDDWDYYEDPFEPCEAVVIIDYLGKYDLVR